MTTQTPDTNGLVPTGKYTAVNPTYANTAIDPRVAAINASIASSPLGSLGISQDPYNKAQTILSSANGQKTADKLKADVQNETNIIAGVQQNKAQTQAAQTNDTPPEVQAEIKALQTQGDKDIESISSLFTNMGLANEASTKAQLSELERQYKQSYSETQTNNNENQRNLRTAGIRSGLSRYSPEAFAQSVYRNAQDNASKLQDLDSKYNSLVGEANTALRKEQFTLAKEKFTQVQAIKESFQKQISEMQKAAREAREKNQENIVSSAVGSLVGDFGMTDPTAIADTLRKMGVSFNSKQLKDALDVYNPQGSGIVAEYNFYKKDAIANNQTPVDFNTYQDMDANRKKAIAKAGVAEYGGYDSQQQKAIDQINTSISNNPTYKKYSSMQTYVNNVETGLSSNSGIGDIAAINQFQKVIDEGAVTRDQDVQLIQGAQSLANSLKTKIKSLENGDKLSVDQRKQMLEISTKMLAAQKKAVSTDPAIQAQKTKAERYKVDPSETIIGELENIGDKIIQDEADAESKLTSYYAQNPGKQAGIDKAIQVYTQKYGKEPSAWELLQVFPEINQ